MTKIDLRFAGWVGHAIERGELIAPTRPCSLRQWKRLLRRFRTINHAGATNVPDPLTDRKALIEQSIVGIDHREPGQPKIDGERPARRQPRSIFQPAVKNRLAQPVIHLIVQRRACVRSNGNRQIHRLLRGRIRKEVWTIAHIVVLVQVHFRV